MTSPLPNATVEILSRYVVEDYGTELHNSDLDSKIIKTLHNVGYEFPDSMWVRQIANHYLRSTNGIHAR